MGGVARWDNYRPRVRIVKTFSAARHLSEQNRCQNQIPDDAKGQDQLNQSGSNWICPNVVPTKCKEINQSAPSRHHIGFQAWAFKLQKPFVESDVKAHELKACLVSGWSKVLSLPCDWSGLQPWIVCYDASLNVWCTSGAKKSTQWDSWKNECSLYSKTIWGRGYAETYPSSNYAMTSIFLAGQIRGQVSVCRAWNALPNNVEHKVEAIMEPFRSPTRHPNW